MSLTYSTQKHLTFEVSYKEIFLDVCTTILEHTDQNNLFHNSKGMISDGVNPFKNSVLTKAQRLVLESVNAHIRSMNKMPGCDLPKKDNAIVDEFAENALKTNSVAMGLNPSLVHAASCNQTLVCLSLV